MTGTCKFSVTRVTKPVITIPIADISAVFGTLDLVILQYRGAYYALPKFDLDRIHDRVLDLTARVRFNTKRPGSRSTVEINLALLPVIPSIVVESSFLEGGKLPGEFENLWKIDPQPNPDTQKHPQALP